MGVRSCNPGKPQETGPGRAWLKDFRAKGKEQNLPVKPMETIGSLRVAGKLLWGKLRRFYLVHFKEAYVEAKMASRLGSCRQCGVCCRFLFRCPALSSQSLCKVYHTCRWKACTVFPLDERDLRDVASSGGSCGYFWREP